MSGKIPAKFLLIYPKCFLGLYPVVFIAAYQSEITELTILSATSRGYMKTSFLNEFSVIPQMVNNQLICFFEVLFF
jgi:hypothetical protein